MHLFNQIAAAIFTFELQINLRLKLSLAITNGSICQYKTQPGECGRIKHRRGDIGQDSSLCFPYTLPTYDSPKTLAGFYFVKFPSFRHPENPHPSVKVAALHPCLLPLRQFSYAFPSCLPAWRFHIISKPSIA